MDAFALSLSYGIGNLSKRNMIVTAITVGIFHFFMPLIGNVVGLPLFEYTLIKPRYVLFVVFLILSIDMIIHFFESEEKRIELNFIGTLLFAISVSFDSFSVGLGISYIYDNILLVVSSFCLISMIFTFLGFILGKKISNKIGKLSFLLGGVILFLYSLLVLTNH